jgi:P27 family predicted phage terminase small subunit
MKGRKPKPTFLRLVEGNRGRRPVNRNEPKPAGRLQSPPPWFTAAQGEIWSYAIEHAPDGLLRCLDRETLAVWCVACEMWQRAVERQAALDANSQLPMLIKTPDGFLVQSPYLPIINKQAAIMLKAAAELGFTPSSRTRISIPDGDGKYEDKAKKYLE